MGDRTLIQDDNQTEALDHLLAFDLKKGDWRIQRPDGLYYQGYVNDRLGNVFTADAAKGYGYQSEQAALRVLAIMQGSARSRRTFRGCKPVCLVPLLEPGDLVVCACGLLHEGCYCPTEAGHGVVL